jgi:hypothetical protein
MHPSGRKGQDVLSFQNIFFIKQTRANKVSHYKKCKGRVS